jgi:oligoribonuclease NrnB/cAMP/cGMP phosphodiesterase (DHH superfamily)
MDESLIDADQLSLARKSVVPGTGFFISDDDEGPDTEQIAALSRAEVVVIADSDADGLGCTALIRDAYDDVAPSTVDPTKSTDEIDLPEERVTLLPTAPHRLTDAQLRVLEYASEDVTVYVCDLCPDRDSDLEPLSALVEHASDVHWFDHHQWDPEYERRVRDTGVELVVGESDEECSTDVTLRSLDQSFDPRFEELAEVTRDHDLWLREDPRSDDLADFGHWVAPEVYVATVRAHGADLPEDAQEYIKEQRIEKDKLIRKAIERAEMRDVDGITVGITYGRCSQNEVAEALREQGADAAVIVKPSGSASIRGTDEFERCHEVAAQVSGGGHPKAAGCKPDIYDDILDFAHHWTTRGAVAKQMILNAFRTLPPEEDAVDGSDS